MDRGLLVCKILSSGCVASAGRILVFLATPTFMTGVALLLLMPGGRDVSAVPWPLVADTVQKMQSMQFGKFGFKTP
jgi:hypothetical protein